MSTIIESLISEQNQFNLFYNILLSVKSKNPSVRVEEDKSRGRCKLESNSISVGKYDDSKTDISSFSVVIDREEVSKIFKKNTYKYNIKIDGSTRGYTNFNRMYFKHDFLSDRCINIVGQIFDYLYDIEEQRKIIETNSKVLDIINDISFTIDKSYRRDNKIDKVLN